MLTIMALPLGDNVDADQLQALKDLAGVIKCARWPAVCARPRPLHAPAAGAKAVQRR